MRTPILLAVLGLASSVEAQLALPDFGLTHTATVTRGFWFRAPTAFVITGLRVPNEALVSWQAVEVIDFGVAPPSFPNTLQGTQLFYSNNQAATTVIPTSIAIAQGSYIGVLGCCTPTVGSTTSSNSYGTPPGPFTSNILGSPVTLTRLGTQFGIGAGGNRPCFQEAAYEIGRVEVYVAPTPGYAHVTYTGVGCISVPDVSSYELFPFASSFDLENMAITLLHTGTGYTARPGLTTYVPPSGAATVLTLADDGDTTVSLPTSMPMGSSSISQLTVCSNGFISAGPGNGFAWQPAAAAFLNRPRACWSVAWHDFDPTNTSGGRVKFEVVAGIAYVTWDGVWDYQGTSALQASTFQAQFDLASGNVHYVYQTLSNAANNYLTGFSDAGPSANPGSMNISAALPGTYTAAVFRIVPLQITASQRPVFGTTISLDSTNVPAAGLIGLTFFGWADLTPGIDLGFLGMPGCNLYTDLITSATFVPAGGVGSTSLFIPFDTGLAGMVVQSQSAAIVPGINPLGLISSNAAHLTLDLH
jgi:hypothetical protein